GADVGTGLARGRAAGRGGGDAPGRVRPPRTRRRVTEAGRQVLLLTRAVVEVGGDEGIGGHGGAGYFGAWAGPDGAATRSLSSRPYWIESSSACHEASMMFSLRPIVLHVLAPLVQSISPP